MGKEGNAGNKTEQINVQMEIWKEKYRRRNKWNKGPRVQGNISQQDLRKGLFQLVSFSKVM